VLANDSGQREDKEMQSQTAQLDTGRTRWLRNSALLGSLLWASLAAAAGWGHAPLGIIELLFLFAPLVVVPLGLALAQAVVPPRFPAPEAAVQLAQPLAAIFAVTSFWLSPGKSAALLAAPWAILCLWISLVGLLTLFGTDRSPTAIAVNIGRMDLAVAAAWLLASRSGMRPLGFQEPIILLTAIHFHFTGFATAILAGTLSAFTQRRNQCSQLLRLITVVVVFVPFLIAAGFVFSPTLKVAAVFALSISIASLAAFQFRCAAVLRNRSARGFLRTSSAAVVIGMVLAGMYALGDYRQRDWLLIPLMASTHGLLNGLGFVMFGLLGWLVESSQVGGKKCAPRCASHQSNLGSLPDTFEVSRTVGN
jgi:YndJ-like protein